MIRKKALSDWTVPFFSSSLARSVGFLADEGETVVKKRPNILFLMSDEHRPTVAGFAGNEVVRTPNLDKLAETGVLFNHAYTPSPITVPTMVCINAGQMPKTCDCEGWKDIEPGHMTMARQFTRYAYETVACGRLMHQGPDLMAGWARRIGADNMTHDQYVEDKVQEEWAHYAKSLLGIKWSDAKEIKRAGVGYCHTHKWDDYALQGAIDYIEWQMLNTYYDRENPERPLLLRLGLTQPHYPYLTDEERFQYYLNRVQPFANQRVFEHPFLSQRQVRPGIDASEREIRRAVAAYYGMVDRIDEIYGEVMAALEFAGQDLDDWIIVYTSDHGEMLGEHGIWEKQKFFEGSARVPLIIRYPAMFNGGHVVNENVSTLDLFATLCDLAGIPIPEGLDSRSLVPLMQGDTSHWSNEALSQFGTANYMIKQDALKYQYYGKEMPEVLFDLEADPGETYNLIDDPAYAKAVTGFRARLAELGHGPNADPNYVNAGY